MSTFERMAQQLSTRTVEPWAEVIQPGYRCDACGLDFEGQPAGAGLFLSTRGDEVRYEEPPLCETCAPAVALEGTFALMPDDM